MTAERARQSARQRHVAEKATIDHLIQSLSSGTREPQGRVLDAVTESGLTIEDQVRKTWNRMVIGLAIF